MPQHRVYITILFLFWGQLLFAQYAHHDTLPEVEITAQSLLNYDTNYIRKFNEHVVSFAPLISAPNFELRFNPETDSLKNKHSSYRPYLRDVVGFAFSYRAVTLSLRVKGRISPEEEHLYGSTRYSIIRLRLNVNPVLFDFYHNTFRGFSDRNAQAYDISRTDKDPYVKREDITMQYSKLRVLYMLSHKKFSYRAAYRFTERQKKTKASAFISSHLYRIHTWGDSAFFNKGQENLFAKYQNLKDLRVYSFGLGPGFAATLVEKKWFFSFAIQIVGDLQYHTAYNTDKHLLSEGTSGAIMGDASFSGGYNGDRFFITLLGRGDRNIIALPNVNTSTSFFTSELSIGFRFCVPKVVGKVYDATPLRFL